MAVLVLACLASAVTHYFYLRVWTWVILVGTAAFDGLLYLWVRDVVVCYRCNAHHRAVQRSAEHAPFDLGIQERYRQERIRRNSLS